MQRRQSKHGQIEESAPSSVDSPDTDGPRLRVPSRSPHPYYRRRPDEPLTLQSNNPPRTPNSNGSSRRPHTGMEEESFVGKNDKRRGQAIMSPSESGTEADDEGYGFIKALPAPPSRPRKGLRETRDIRLDGSVTPLLTPSHLDDDVQRCSFESTPPRKAEKGWTVNEEEMRIARAKFVKRRRAELIRRASELALMVVIGILALKERHVWDSLRHWHRELLSHLLIATTLCVLYPIRLVAYSWRRTAPRIRFWLRLRIPASFDPAPILYPVFLPAVVALSLLSSFSKATLPNVVLGLSALPTQLIPGPRNETYCMTHWMIAILPLILSENTDFPSKLSAKAPYMLKSPPPEGLHPETIVSLFPLHQALLPLLHHLTTTSLLPAELQLLSICLINLYLFAQAPHSVILSTILWIGGLGLVAFAAPVLRWGVALARVPRWRLRRAGRIVQTRQSFISSLHQALTRSRNLNRRVVDSDADDDEDEAPPERSSLSLETLKEELLGSLKTNLFPTAEVETRSAIEPTADFPSPEKTNGLANQSRRRRYTLPNITGPVSSSRQGLRSRTTRSRSSLGHSFLSLTPQEAAMRKWTYAMYVYIVMALLILGPIRYLVCRYALNRHEPFGWAVGYLFGNIRDVRFQIFNWDLESWISLPPLIDQSYSDVGLFPFRLPTIDRAEHLRQYFIGEANTRLCIAAYCLLIIAIGLITVLRLSVYVEVDTRRKVFHGMMVAMLLPTIFIDPTFIALALGLILAIFLILDLLRASQLPPLSKPIAYFLTPYVDGRDLRGPVVVSHIFLLIGCAVPLWLSLAGTQIYGGEPWKDWEVRSRDVSMISGVVCVGMGDAAASLIGRRYGHHKWPWSGGKSLEGSAAFAFAVTIGLTFGKVWLRLGQWNDLAEQGSEASSWLTVGSKAGVAACAASFMEAVLTGGNDNVVVPVALWLVVRAVGV